MLYLAVKQQKIESEMITQKNTASNSSLAIWSSIISAKDHKNQLTGNEGTKQNNKTSMNSV